MPRAKVKPQISPDVPALGPKRMAPKLAEEPKTAAAQQKVDWRLDANLRAFACLLSYETGWMTEPPEIAWMYDDSKKVVVVMRPPESTTLFNQTEAPPSIGAPQALLDIQRRWGDAVREKVERYAFPSAAPEVPQGPAPGARFLRTLANACVAAGPTEERIGIALATAVRHCVDLARSANQHDQSASATFTRQVASALLLDLISPQSSGQ